MPIQRYTSLERKPEEAFVTLRFYKVLSRYEEDNEVLEEVEQTGWVRIPITDLGKVMVERGIHEFVSEEDMAVLSNCSESGVTKVVLQPA